MSISEASLHLRIQFHVMCLKALFLGLFCSFYIPLTFLVLCTNVAWDISVNDDKQLYFHIKSNVTTVTNSILESCISDSHISNHLWLNRDQTELTWCSSAWHAGSFMQPSASTDGSVIRANDSICDLRIILWADLSINDQISAVVCSYYYNIKQLCSIHASLTCDSLRDAAYALIICHIDHCKLFLPDVLIRHLQMLLNTAVRAIYVVILACVISQIVIEMTFNGYSLNKRYNLRHQCLYTSLWSRLYKELNLSFRIFHTPT